MSEHTSIDEVLNEIKSYLDATDKVKISVVFANNTSGKTRLSKLFTERYNEKVLCYNAFLEDCFSWDNENYTFIIKDCWAKSLIKDEGLDRQIIDNFQKFTNSKIEPSFDLKNGVITFKLIGDDEDSSNIKISKGEESIFIWAVFYTILTTAVENLTAKVDDRTTEYFNKLKYIIIDDPVSSMDDIRIITVGLAISALLEKIVTSQDKLQPKLRVLITTHHALFFNILHGKDYKQHKQQDYILSRQEKVYTLTKQDKSSPFAYHHEMITEIQQAITNNDLKRYHFTLFRSLLEKTANFLGYKGGWSVLLENNSNKELIVKMLNHYSHSQLSEIETKLVESSNKELFKTTFEKFLNEYHWNYVITEPLSV